MALLMAFEHAKANQRINKGNVSKGILGEVVITPFFGLRNAPDRPDAHLAQRDAGRTSRPHFHACDQFQVVVDGKGKLGRHDLAPYAVHFSRAYTPYGPLLSKGLTYFVLRTRHDPGAQNLPEHRDKLKHVPNRQPWQTTVPFTFPSAPSRTTDSSLREILGLQNDQGLAAHTLSMKPGAQAHSPDPFQGDGQYLIVTRGGLVHNGREYQPLSLVFVEPNEGRFPVHAGPNGLEAIVLNFPRAQIQIAPNHKTPTASSANVWQCTLCAFAYDETRGLPNDNIAAGTRWKDLADSWTCPDCGAAKSDFEQI